MFEDSKELSEAFLENHALFHKSCVSTYNKTKLGRKRKYVESFAARDDDEKLHVSNDSSPCRLRTNRSNTNLQNFCPRCFFCGEGDSEEKLHQCETFSVHQKVFRIAHELQDTLIMGKLSEGDMIATEAMYHVNCLVSYYNKYRRHQSVIPGEDNVGTLGIIKGSLSISKHVSTIWVFEAKSFRFAHLP